MALLRGAEMDMPAAFNNFSRIDFQEALGWDDVMGAFGGNFPQALVASGPGQYGSQVLLGPDITLRVGWWDSSAG